MKFDPNITPEKIRSLPVSHHGYPIPFFVLWIDGKPDFRAVDPVAKAKCLNGDLCWICGQKLGRYKAFVSGPLFAVNQQSVEPPSHRDCAIFAVQVCPFMVMPKSARRSVESIKDITVIEESVIPENPGGSIIWVANKFRTVQLGGNYLFVAGDPSEVLWYVEGTLADRSKAKDALERSVERAIASHPSLTSDKKAKEGFEAMAATAYKYLPK